MRFLPSSWALAALLLGGTLLGACGGDTGHASTNTPSSTLGTDSAATKVGGNTPMTDSVDTGSPMTPPAGGVSGTTAGTTH